MNRIDRTEADNATVHDAPAHPDPDPVPDEPALPDPPIPKSPPTPLDLPDDGLDLPRTG